MKTFTLTFTALVRVPDETKIPDLRLVTPACVAFARGFFDVSSESSVDVAINVEEDHDE